MNTYISMLRGINVSGQKRVKMDELRSLYEALNLVKVRSYVQSGNVIFDSQEVDLALLSERIEERIKSFLGFHAAVIMRRREDFQRIIQSNPFLTRRNEDPSKLHVTFLSEDAAMKASGDMASPNGEGDEFFVDRKEVFLFCPNGYGRTRLNNNYFERKLNVSATTRNWNTVMALEKMAGEEVS